MQTIRYHDDLFALLFERLLKSEPQVEVSAKLVAIGREVASEFADVGYFVRYDETCWQETFEDILDGLAKPQEQVRCGQRLLPFLAASTPGLPPIPKSCRWRTPEPCFATC